MKITKCLRNRLLVPLAMGAIVLTVIALGGRSVVQAMDKGEMHVDITITDLGYSVKGHTMPNQLTSITIRNNGTIPHGITSPAFTKGIIKKEGDGVETRDSKGKGYRAYHLEPGKVMTLHFSQLSNPEQETAQIPFWCDIHTHMKGEFLIVETKGEY